MLKLNLKQLLNLLVVLMLLVGLGAGVYLVQTKQLLKSFAASEINSALTVTDENGQDLQYMGNNTFKTTSTHVRVGIKDLESLK